MSPYRLFVCCAFLLLSLLAASPDNTLEKLGLKQGQFYYIVHDEMGPEGTGIAPPCRELTQAVLDGYAPTLRCEKRAWYGVEYQSCKANPDSLLIFQKLADCMRNREQYLGTHG
jgi:hypothetical protein